MTLDDRQDNMKNANDAANDAELDPAVLRAARDYNRPSDLVPRESMWDAIQARRAASAAESAAAQPLLRVERGGAAATPHDPTVVRAVQTVRYLPQWRYAAAAMLLLAAGIGIGRAMQWGQPGANGSLRLMTEGTYDSTGAAAFQFAAAEHFGQVETLLTWVNATPDARRDAQVAAWSRDLLASTRLLLDSPAGKDPRRRQLLGDLELVLVQMVQLAPEAATEDRTAVDDLLRRTTLLLTRIRTIVPAGMAPVHD